MSGVRLRPPLRLGSRSWFRRGVAARGRDMARAAVAAGGGRDGLGPPPPPAPSHNGPAGTFPPAERESRAGSPSPPRATWRGPFVWAAFRPFVPVPGVASSGEPPGPVPGWDRSLGIRLRSPDRVKVHLSEPAGRSGSSGTRQRQTEFVLKTRGYCLALSRQPRAT